MGIRVDGLDGVMVAGKRPNSDFVSARIRPRERTYNEAIL